MIKEFKATLTVNGNTREMTTPEEIVKAVYDTAYSEVMKDVYIDALLAGMEESVLNYVERHEGIIKGWEHFFDERVIPALDEIEKGLKRIGEESYDKEEIRKLFKSSPTLRHIKLD